MDSSGCWVDLKQKAKLGFLECIGLNKFFQTFPEDLFKNADDLIDIHGRELMRKLF